MKKIYAAAMLFAALILNYQTYAQKGFSLSVIASPQFSFLQNKNDRNNNSLEQKATLNAAFGFGASYSFRNNAAVGVDVLYSMQGQRYTTSGQKSYQKQNYIKVPLYFIYTGNTVRRVSFVGKIGPQLSILTNSQISDGQGNDINTATEDWYKSVTLGGITAAGVQFRLSPKMYLTTMARFDYDFTNAEDEAHSHWPSSRAKTNNMTTGLEVGLKVKLD